MSSQKIFVNYVLVYLLLFLSGSWRYNLAPNPYLLAGFVMVAAAWYLFSDRRVSDKFILYAITFTLFLLALSLYTGGGITLTSGISGVMKLVIAYLIIQTVGARFSEVYIKVVVFLAVFSLFGYFTDSYNLFDGLISKLPPVGEMGYEGFLYVYRFSWQLERNNSIFFEPGAYQAFLNAALFLLFFTKTDFRSSTKLWYVAILLAALVTTFSTTGFVIFLAMLPLVLYQSNLITLRGKMTIIGVGVIVVAVFSAQFYTYFVEKMSDYLTADEYSTEGSASSRSSDMQTDLKIFKKHIFGVGYDKYNDEFLALGRRDKDKIGSSNGVTRTLATMGLPFSLFIFSSFFLAFKRLLGDMPKTIVAFGMFMLFLTGESYYVATPVTYAIIAAAFVYKREESVAKIQGGSDGVRA